MIDGVDMGAFAISTLVTWIRSLPAAKRSGVAIGFDPRSIVTSPGSTVCLNVPFGRDEAVHERHNAIAQHCSTIEVMIFISLYVSGFIGDHLSSLSIIGGDGSSGTIRFK